MTQILMSVKQTTEVVVRQPPVLTMRAASPVPVHLDKSTMEPPALVSLLKENCTLCLKQVKMYRPSTTPYVIPPTAVLTVDRWTEPMKSRVRSVSVIIRFR